MLMFKQREEKLKQRERESLFSMRITADTQTRPNHWDHDTQLQELVLWGKRPWIAYLGTSLGDVFLKDTPSQSFIPLVTTGLHNLYEAWGLATLGLWEISIEIYFGKMAVQDTSGQGWTWLNHQPGSSGKLCKKGAIPIKTNCKGVCQADDSCQTSTIFISLSKWQAVKPCSQALSERM